jgi:hypothetical protein
MTSSTRIFAITHPRLLAAVVLVLIACSAVAAAHAHRSADPIVPREQVQVEARDYLAWHRQEARAFEPDSLSGSLRLFSNIADKLAADASAEKVMAGQTSFDPAAGRAVRQ